MLLPITIKRSALSEYKKQFVLTGGVDEGVETTLNLLEVTRSSALLKEVCPQLPGVYWMSDREDNVLYVGKAKNLKTRLSTYFRAKNYVNKEWRIIVQAKTLSWVTLPDEFCCLLRELEIIERLQPKLNVRANPLRTRATYLCLGKSEAPHFFLSKIPLNNGYVSLGPLSLSSLLRESVKILNDYFLLQDCPTKTTFIYSNQLSFWKQNIRPACLRSEIRRCLGPCAAKCSHSEYYSKVDEALEFILRKNNSLIENLENTLKKQVECLEFEEASITKRILEKLLWLLTELEKLSTKNNNEAIFYCPYGPTNTYWYLISKGIVRMVVKAPSHEDEFEIIKKKTEEMLSNNIPQTRSSLSLVEQWMKKTDKSSCVISVKEAFEKSFEEIKALML